METFKVKNLKRANSAVLSHTAYSVSHSELCDLHLNVMLHSSDKMHLNLHEVKSYILTAHAVYYSSLKHATADMLKIVQVSVRFHIFN